MNSDGHNAMVSMVSVVAIVSVYFFSSFFLALRPS
jgi:hypothetical protein